MERPPCHRSLRWEERGHQEATQVWKLLLQLQGVLFFSIVLLALVEYRFRWVDIGSEGSCSHFKDIGLKDKIDGSIGFPEASLIQPGGPDLPYLILADDAFALKILLMKTFSKVGMTRPEMIANYRTSRRMVENAFGILSSLFIVFHEAILVHGKGVKDIVLACVVLPKMLRAQRGVGGWAKRDLEDEEIPCDLEDDDEGHGHDRNPPNSAKEQRNYLKRWFNIAGAGPWQDVKV